MKKMYEAQKNIAFSDEERKKSEEAFLKKLSPEERKTVKKTINDYYYKNKVEENTILIQGLGVNVRGNMQYVLNELNHNDAYKDFKIYVRTKDGTDDIVKGYIEQNGWTRTTTVPKNYSKYLETCQYLITESYFPYSWVKKPGQVLIDLWHGTPLKCIGLYKNGKSCHVNGIQQKNFLYSDYLLYPNDYTEEKMLMSYRIESLLSAKALMLGYPRTGGLLAVSKERQEEIKKILAPNGEKIYAYMPTWKGYLSEEEVVAQSKALLDYLDANLTDSQILYVNLHHKVGDSIDYSTFNHIKKFPPLVDSYELMTTTEALISDYSSVFFDYLVLGKQIILDLEDSEAYLQHQGLYIDVATLPFDKAYSKAAILEAINSGKRYDDKETIESFCKYDSADNSKRLCRLLIGDENGLELHEHNKNDKNKVLFFAYSCPNGVDTDILEQFMGNHDRDKYEVYLSCEELAIDETKNTTRAYPMLYDNLVIGFTNDEKWLSGAGKLAKEKYLNGSISFEEAMKVLKYDYRLVFDRAYGDVKFDAMYIYDAGVPELMLGFALSDVKKKLLFINDRMINVIKNGDKFLKDAVKYCASLCNGIYVFSDKQKVGAVDILGTAWKEYIQVINNAKELNELLESVNNNLDKYDMPEVVPVKGIISEKSVSPKGKRAVLRNIPVMFKNQLLAHSLGGYEGRTYLNNEHCFNNAIKLGYKYFEADIKLLDGKLVCTHGWSKTDCDKTGMEYNKAFENMTYDMFMQQNIAGMPVMDVKKLYTYMLEHKDICLELDLHKLSYEDSKLAAKLILENFENDKQILDRLLIQVQNANMYKGINEVYHFKNYQYILLENIHTIDKSIEFCVKNGIMAIAIKKKYANADNIKKIKDAGIAVLVFSVDEIDVARNLFALGVNTICTNFITPDMLYDNYNVTVVYNSTAGATEGISKLIFDNILKGKLTRVKSGAYEYLENISYSKTQKYNLMTNMFKKDGYNFKGWYLRYRKTAQDEWKYYCTNGQWCDKSKIGENGEIRMLFDDKMAVDLFSIVEGNKVIFEAVWEK